jgi:Down-regulated in metastasis
MKLLNTNDSKLQKLALDCLLKSDSEAGVLRQYRKLLEGFTDDIKFKDMIQVVNFGSQVGSSGGMAGNTNEDEATQVDNKKDAKANNIPKLAEQHRVDVLPVIIKLLLSKLIKKKGAINKKTVHTRRTIVYQFMSQLNPEIELKLFFNELLSSFDLTIEDECLLNTNK